MPFVQAHDDEELLEEVRRVVAQVRSGPVTQAHFEQMSSMTSTMTLLRRFGPWSGVFARAGHADRYSGRTVSAKMRSQRSRTLTDTEIIAELQRVAVAAGTTTLVLDVVRSHSETLGAKVLLKRFGSFPAALSAAGLSHAPHANRWTEETSKGLDRAVIVAAALRSISTGHLRRSTGLVILVDMGHAPPVDHERAVISVHAGYTRPSQTVNASHRCPTGLGPSQNPLSTTTNARHRATNRPLKAVARVRIPSGLRLESCSH